jgi:Right handed beta helix region
MALSPFPWKNKGESEPTKLNRQNLNAAEEALASQVTSGAIAPPSTVVFGTGISSATAGQSAYYTGSAWAAGNTDFINPIRAPYNGIGDGAAHALNTRFSTLAEAQVVYPFATSLTQQIDYCAIRLAVQTAEEAGGGSIWLGRRTWVTQQEIQWGNQVHAYGVSRARTLTLGLNVGSVITNSSTGTLVGATFTATTASSITLEAISSFAEIAPNIAISGSGIPTGTHIVSVNEGAGTAVLSQAATASASGVTITPGKSMINTSGCVNWGFHSVNLNYVGSIGNNVAMAISDFAGKGAVVSGLGTIEHCYFNNFGGTATVGLYGDVNYIFANEFDQPVGHCVLMANSGGNSNNVGTDGFIAYNGSGYTFGNGHEPGAVGDGIRLEEGGYYLVLANAMYNCANGINIVNAPTNRVIGNRCEKHDFHGIAVTGSTSTSNVVTGNIVFNCGYAEGGASGIAVSGGSHNTISGNFSGNILGASGGELAATMTSTGTATEKKTLKNVHTVSSARISNLRVGALVYSHLNLPEGTYITSFTEVNSTTAEVELSQEALVTGTNIEIFVLPMSGGISLSGNTARNNVTGNYIFNVDESALGLNTATYNTVANNVIDTCGKNGITLSGTSSNNSISTNYVYNAAQRATNTYYGIVITSGANNLIHGCMIFGPATNKVQFGVFVSTSSATGTHVLDCYCVGGNYASGAFSDTGTGTLVRNFRGYTVGSITVSVPASGTAVTGVAYDRHFYVTAGASGTTKMAISNGPEVTVPASSLATIFIPAQTTLTPTYTSAPTWVVHGYGD